MYISWVVRQQDHQGRNWLVAPFQFKGLTEFGHVVGRPGYYLGYYNLPTFENKRLVDTADNTEKEVNVFHWKNFNIEESGSREYYIPFSKENYEALKKHAYDPQNFKTMLRTAKDSRVITVKEEDFLSDNFDAVWKRVTSPSKIEPADIDEYFRWKTTRDSKEDHFQ